MKLRLKTLLVVSTVMAVLFVALFIAIRFSLEREFAALERQAAGDDIGRVQAAVTDDVNQLDRITADWAPRDQTYAFMQGTDPAFLDQLSEEALNNLGVNFMVFLDLHGNVVHTESFDLDLGVRQKMDARVLRSILKSPDLQRPADPRSRAVGLLKSGDRVLLVAARSITSSDLYSPPAGTLVLARYIDAAELERLGSVTKLNVGAWGVDGRAPAADVVVAARSLQATSAVFTQPMHSGSLGAYALMRDVGGSPALILRATLPRQIYAQGQDAIAYAAIAMLIIGLAATGTVAAVVDRSVLGRIGRLSKEMARIGENRDTSSRVTISGHDELAALAEDVNDALAAIDDSEQQLMAARDELESRVRDRTVELRASEARFRILIEQMADALFCVDPAGHIVFVNSAAEDLSGLSTEDMVGRQFTDLMMAQGNEIEERLNGDLQPDSTWTVEAKLVALDQAPVAVELSASSLIDEHARVSGTQWVARDITERKRFEQQMFHAASHDHLTGLHNRHYFETALELELAEARRQGGRGAIVWLDVDDFKDVNDSLGHRAGDQVLIELADQLRKQVRESNVLARLGGDEFGVLMPRASAEEASVAATRMLAAINSRPLTVEGHSVTLSASLGVVAYPDHGATASELLANADMAMYWAKDRGRSQVHVHEMDQVHQQELRSRTQWNDRIMAALNGEGMQVYAQPMLDLRSGRVYRFELLARMLDDDGVPILPAEFLPAAERSGAINDIDRWMACRAVELLAQTQDWELQLEVNLSGKAFLDPTLLPAIRRALDESGTEPARLGFEITETAAIADIGRAQAFIASLKELGCRFSLDDFGSGFSSFYHLKHLPVDCLKIDGSFIRGLAHGMQDRHLVRGMVELSRGLEIEVAAEYVEDAETLQIVRSLDIDYAQGFQVGHPVPIRQALDEFSKARSKEALDEK